MDPVVNKVSNLRVTAEITGATSGSPEGDGSGKVVFKAIAENASMYRLTFQGISQTMPNGEATLTFDYPGVQEYEVRISALGALSSQVTETVVVKVRRVFDVPADLMALLIGNDQQVWRIKSETAGHMGVGPKGADSPEYWMAQAFEKDFTSLYDDVYIFGADKAFNHRTGGAVYGQEGPLSSDFGSVTASVNSEGEIENYPLEDYTESWYYGPVNNEETLFLSGGGFLGFYVGGSHAYTILA
jgi:hypothetical protein